MESTKEQVKYVTFELTVWEVDRDSFCVGGRRFWCRNHDFKINDRVKLTIEALHQDHNPPGTRGPVGD